MVHPRWNITGQQRDNHCQWCYCCDAGEELTPSDPLADESLALAGISAASVLGRIALGRRAGARVWRLGHDPDAPWVASTGPRQAHLDGFDLHANLCVPATDRARLEQLCR